jgi:D-3-phosphoglycerate dehydrogenase
VPDDYPAVFTGSAAEARLRALGDVTIHTARGADDETELARRVGDAVAVVNIRAHAHFSARVLEACPNIRLISVWGTGTDNIDLDACRAKNVTIRSTAGVNARAVAEHAVALMLSVLRRIPAMDADLRNGGWARSPIAQLEGKTVGIIGLGAIGARTAELAKAFGVRLLASTWGPDNGRAAALGANHVSIEQLLRESDVVSVHLQLTAETTRFLNRERLALMKPTACLVNTARGAVIDRDALVDALRNGRLAGAALDVFHDEPLPPLDPLLSLRNVVLTPQIAGMTPEVIAAGLDLAVRNVELFLANAPA